MYLYKWSAATASPPSERQRTKHAIAKYHSTLTKGDGNEWKVKAMHIHGGTYLCMQVARSRFVPTIWSIRAAEALDHTAWRGPYKLSCLKFGYFVAPSILGEIESGAMVQWKWMIIMVWPCWHTSAGSGLYATQMSDARCQMPDQEPQIGHTDHASMQSREPALSTDTIVIVCHTSDLYRTLEIFKSAKEMVERRQSACRPALCQDGTKPNHCVSARSVKNRVERPSISVAATRALFHGKAAAFSASRELGRFGSMRRLQAGPSSRTYWIGSRTRTHVIGCFHICSRAIVGSVIWVSYHPLYTPSTY